MKLAERQEQLVTQYLREVAHFAGDNVSSADRERGLVRLEARVRDGIARLRKVQPEDADIEGVLKAIGPPAVQAALLDAPEPSDERAKKAAGRVWLGVCQWLAEKMDFPPRLVRAGALALGVTGPLALFGYVGAYAVMRRGIPKEEREPIDWLTLAWRMASTLVIIYLLNLGFGYLLKFLELAYSEGAERGLPEIGDWGVLRYKADQYYSYAFWFAVPLAGFSALPLLGGWGKSIYRFSQALIALYAIALCWGTAKFIVGLILDLVKQFSGNVEMPWSGML